MIYVQQQDFDPGALILDLHQTQTQIGAVASFLGLVRDFLPQGKTPITVSPPPALDHLYIEHYAGMTEKMLANIETQACQRWSLQNSVIVHRFGALKPGDRIVFVGCCAPHRQDAFDACNFMMDWLKTEAPFWKKEQSQQGRTHWVDAKESDQQAQRKWQTS